MRNVVEKSNRPDEKEVVGEEASEIQIDPCLLKELRRVHPEWFVGTPEWDLKVRLEMAQRMYNETGLIMML